MNLCSSNLTVEQIHKETNGRMFERVMPSKPLQPYINVRPVMSRYAYFPIVEPRKEPNVKLTQFPTFNTTTTFNPGNTLSPWSGFASNVNKESELRNQVFALQQCSQSVYVPSSDSDLYTYSFKTVTKPNPHELLFHQDSFYCFNPNPNENKIGTDLFNNSTRSQVRDLTK